MSSQPLPPDTRLSRVEEIQSDALAEQIISAVRIAYQGSAGRAPEEQRNAAEDAIQSVLEISGATPRVARAAVLKARGRLVLAGLLCDPTITDLKKAPKGKRVLRPALATLPETSCGAIGDAFRLALAAIDAAQGTGAIGGEGPAAIGGPPPPGAGPGGGPTHPLVAGPS